MVRLCSLGLDLIESPAGRIADRPRSPSLRSAGAQVRPAHGLAEVFASSASAPSRSYAALLRRASLARVVQDASHERDETSRPIGNRAFLLRLYN
jgi:hypothetical protein